MFSDSETADPQKGSDAFWVLANALAQFTQKNGGCLPVSTDLPDMTCETGIYVKLKAMYVDVNMFSYFAGCCCNIVVCFFLLCWQLPSL